MHDAGPLKMGRTVDFGGSYWEWFMEFSLQIGLAMN